MFISLGQVRLYWVALQVIGPAELKHCRYNPSYPYLNSFKNKGEGGPVTGFLWKSINYANTQKIAYILLFFCVIHEVFFWTVLAKYKKKEQFNFIKEKDKRLSYKKQLTKTDWKILENCNKRRDEDFGIFRVYRKDSFDLYSY